jgi:molecular chaperone DnaK
MTELTAPAPTPDVIVGIDLGTTNSLIGVIEAGIPLLLPDAQGERLTPSVVYFPADHTPVVGRAAARMRSIEPAATVYSVKRLIGRRTGEDPDLDVSYAIEGAIGQPVRVKVGAQTSAPEEISALVLAKLKNDAERALATTITRAVITVPAYFNDAQRNATMRAGTLAGFRVERIINEPTAAALAYGLDRISDHARIAVYDFGGGTFDVSILELNRGVFQVLSTNGDTHLGGDDLDAALLARCDLPLPDWQKREVIIEARHQLSTHETAEIPLPFTDGAHSQSYRLTRAELEEIARPIIERTRAHCLRALHDARLAPADLDQVILVGGVTRMPLVRQFVAELFGRAPHTSQNPDEAVARGATIQAGILSGAVRDMVLLDVTPLSLGIETFGGLMNVIIPRNSTIPIKAGEMFTNALSGQRAMQITVLQGEREMARDNWKLGQFELEFTPAPKGTARVGVQFSIDANGILQVLARDTLTGKEKIVALSSAVDVSDEAVEKMLADSLEHAFDDMNERVLTEAQTKAAQMVPAVRSALDRVGAQLAADERALIETRMTELEQAQAIGSAPRLKTATAALDQATQHLAALLLESAMRAAESK